MNLGRAAQLARLAYGFRDFLRHPVGYVEARSAAKQRLEQRESRFLDVARRLIYEVPESPYRQLLLWAGCTWSDLAASTKAHGIERTLEDLRDAGVYLTLEEFKAREPIVRRGLTIETGEADFDYPGTGQAGAGSAARNPGVIAGQSSGSRGKSTRVAYNWEFIAEEAANELLLYTMHGLENAPTAIWYPMPPGIAGLHNLLMNVGWGKPPEKWFTHSRPNDVATSAEARMALQFLYWSARVLGRPIPRPEFADLDDATGVVRWAAGARQRHGASVVRTFGSSAIRIARTAIAEGIDLRGVTLFVGGEPLTEHRRSFIESAGLRVHPRYVVTETGLVAAGCPCPETADDMHVYTDRLALISSPSGALLFTGLTPHTGKVVFNASLGDCGELRKRRCRCAFGDLGFHTHVSGVRGLDKLTVEGMTLLTSELHSIVGSVLREAGGDPDSFQFREVHAGNGLATLLIAISPDIEGIDEQRFIRAVLQRLEQAGPRSLLASHFLRRAESIQIVREQPRQTAGHKTPAVARDPEWPARALN